MPAEQRERAIQSIYAELEWWKKELERQGKFVEAQRVTQRTLFDIEMMRTVGYCHGIENYSRHLSGRLPGEAPPTLLDYVPQDYLLFLDESHSDRSAERAACGAATARANKSSSTTASACPPPSTIARSISRNSNTASNQVDLRLRHARPLRAHQIRRRNSSSRSFAPPASSILRSKFVR